MKEYFQGVFTEVNIDIVHTGSIETPVIMEEQNRMLTAEVEFEEFASALKQMHPDKASGPDGYSPAFFSSTYRVWLERRFFAAANSG